jgi:integrase
MELASSLFRWAGLEANPAVGVKAFKEESSERFLSAAELKAFFSALEEEPIIFRHFFMILLATGVRKSNLLALEWREVDGS